MEQENIQISVIIPVYNTEAHLNACLDGVLSQNIPHLEVICVDDGSTDHSLEVLHQYAAKDSRVVVLTQPNSYAGVARNHGLEVARGEYVAFLDSDDHFLPGALEGLYAQAKAHDLDVLKAGFSYVEEGGEPYTTLYSTLSCISQVQAQRVLRFDQLPLRLLQVPDVPWNGLYRRAFLEQNHIRFNSLRCINDHSFWIACLIHAPRLMVTHTPVACYRVEQSTSLVGRKAAHFHCQLESYEIVREMAKDLPDKLRRSVMRNELNGMFGWYERLRPQAPDVEGLDRQVAEFLKGLDEEEVGVKFLQSFSYSESYYALRYGQPAPKRPNPLVRAVSCWRDHGWTYTWEKLRSRGQQTWVR